MGVLGVLFAVVCAGFGVATGEAGYFAAALVFLVCGLLGSRGGAR
mgnify:FL=1